MNIKSKEGIFMTIEEFNKNKDELTQVHPMNEFDEWASTLGTATDLAILDTSEFDPSASFFRYDGDNAKIEVYYSEKEFEECTPTDC